MSEVKEKGLMARYRVTKIDGTTNPDAEYFVLRLDDKGSDPIHITACREAINTYANRVKNHLPKLYDDLKHLYGQFEPDFTSDDKAKLLDALAEKYGEVNFVAAYVNQEYVPEIVYEAMEKYTAQLQSEKEALQADLEKERREGRQEWERLQVSRIDELQAENTRLREALTNCRQVIIWHVNNSAPFDKSHSQAFTDNSAWALEKAESALSLEVNKDKP